ncbi:ATP-binding protein [bacterium]|nr:ATP-binding protein [bacterium]
MRYARTLNLLQLLDKKSFFLFGPRSTGKTSLIEEQLGEKATIVDLLNADTFIRLTNRPSELEQIIEAGGQKLVVIDEVQKLPVLLDEVHRLIEKKKICFLLTGSSARKLKHGGANMLGGRAWEARLFPLVTKEITDFDLDRYLQFGGLPQVYTSALPSEELNAYVNVYLKEEIQAEGLVRDVGRFTKFLHLASLSTGEVLNFSKLASDVGSAPSTVIEHFRILEDTLIGFFIEPWGRSKKRKEISTAKFYLFDTGVTNTLARVKHLERNSNLYGRAFEQFIAMELRAALSYHRVPEELTFWRTYEKHEVDFVIGEQFAVEVKATVKSSDRDAKSLRLFADETSVPRLYLVSQDPIERVDGRLHFIHFEKFLKNLWDGKLFS